MKKTIARRTKRGSSRRKLERSARPRTASWVARTAEPKKADHEDTPLLSQTKPEPVESARPETGQAPALQLYLREVGQVKLLTTKEEIALASRSSGPRPDRRGGCSRRRHHTTTCARVP